MDVKIIVDGNYFEIQGYQGKAWWRVHPSRVERGCCVYNSNYEEIVPDDINPQELVQMYAPFVKFVDAVLVNWGLDAHDVQALRAHMPSFISYIERLN
jgi:hypothetical protein